MRLRLLPLAVLALVVAACSTGAGGPTETSITTGPTETTASTGDAQPADVRSSSTTAAPGTTETTSGRPDAPDFTLQLGDGGSYTLSEGAKPVYLVFWAEW